MHIFICKRMKFKTGPPCTACVYAEHIYGHMCIYIYGHTTKKRLSRGKKRTEIPSAKACLKRRGKKHSQNAAGIAFGQKTGPPFRVPSESKPKCHAGRSSGLKRRLQNAHSPSRLRSEERHRRNGSGGCGAIGPDFPIKRPYLVRACLRDI